MRPTTTTTPVLPFLGILRTGSTGALPSPYLSWGPFAPTLRVRSVGDGRYYQRKECEHYAGVRCPGLTTSTGTAAEDGAGPALTRRRTLADRVRFPEPVVVRIESRNISVLFPVPFLFAGNTRCVVPPGARHVPLRDGLSPVGRSCPSPSPPPRPHDVPLVQRLEKARPTFDRHGASREVGREEVSNGPWTTPAQP